MSTRQKWRAFGLAVAWVYVVLVCIAFIYLAPTCVGPMPGGTP